MYPATETRWLEWTDEVLIALRRYTSNYEADTCAGGWHEAALILGKQPIDIDAEGYLRNRPEPPHSDPAWPTQCAKCDYEFTEDDTWQVWQNRVQRDSDGKEYMQGGRLGALNLALPIAPPGSMWDSYWMPENFRGPDGIALTVVCPNGSIWCVDSRASNCTMPEDNTHYCWVRHGDPRTDRITVDKNGVTCAAGAGSIQADDYHGFLQNGVLTAG